MPSAVSLAYLSVEVMSTRPGTTFRSTAAWFSADPLRAALSCGDGMSLEEMPADGSVTRAVEGDGQPGADAGRERRDGQVDEQVPAAPGPSRRRTGIPPPPRSRSRLRNRARPREP